MTEVTTTPSVYPTDIDPDDAMRNVVLDRWQVATFATPHFDRRGQTGIRVLIWEDGDLVYDTGPAKRGLVYGSPMHSDDSDQALLSAIALCCHDAQHDSDDNPVEPDWDAEGLSGLAAMAEEDL